MKKKLSLLVVLTSAIGANVISFNLGVFQLSLFRLLISIIAIIMLIDILLLHTKKIKSTTDKSRYSRIFMLIWFIYSIFTLGWVKDYNLWFKALYFLGVGIICIFYFKKNLKNQADIILAIKLMGLMVLLHNVIGWYEVISGNYLFLSEMDAFRFSRMTAPVSMFGNTNNFATYLLFSFFISYICLSNYKHYLVKSLYSFSLISSATLIIYSGSRANILGLGLAILIFVLLNITKKNIKLRYMILILGIVIIVSIFTIQADLTAGIFEIFNFNMNFRFGEQYGSDPTRLNLIKNGFQFLLQTIAFGTGAGNLEYWMQEKAVYQTGGIVNIHNWWMEILVNYGILIFVLYILFYLNLLSTFYRKFLYSQNKNDEVISLSFMSCMIGYIIGSISSSSNFLSEWLWVYWAVFITYQGLNQLSDKYVK